MASDRDPPQNAHKPQPGRTCYNQWQLEHNKTKGISSDKRYVNLTYCARHHALSWHQVVIKALQATIQGVGDSALVVVQRGVHSLLRSQRAPWRLLNEKVGDIRIIIVFILLQSSQ